MKYVPETLVPMFRKAAALRNEMVASGFTDNGGAIHSAERILDILGLRLNYPRLTHINNLRDHPDAEFSLAALAAHERGDQVFIEHVSPLRDLTRHAIGVLDRGATVIVVLIMRFRRRGCFLGGFSSVDYEISTGTLGQSLLVDCVALLLFQNSRSVRQ